MQPRLTTSNLVRVNRRRPPMSRQRPAVACQRFILLCIALFGGCATPSERFLDDAERRGFTAQVAQSERHHLVVLRHGRPTAGEPLHIYLDGDGTPMLSRHQIANDPSSRSRLILDLMERDPAPSVLVGRPCYYQGNKGCDPVLWTDQRYSEGIVAGLAQVIVAESDTAPESPLTLIGYSGGGTLAMLLAPRLRRVERVVTVAANLDVTAWTAHHGYSALVGSLNPADAPPLPSHIRQLHLFGENDKNVPAALMRHVAERSSNSAIRIVPGYNHACCWAKTWPAPIAERTN
jgi:pimeloyl-ACP methyl ester carboxylesterase